MITEETRKAYDEGYDEGFKAGYDCGIDDTLDNLETYIYNARYAKESEGNNE